MIHYGNRDNGGYQVGMACAEPDHYLPWFTGEDDRGIWTTDNGTRYVREPLNVDLITCPICRTHAFEDGFRILKERLAWAQDNQDDLTQLLAALLQHLGTQEIEFKKSQEEILIEPVNGKFRLSLASGKTGLRVRFLSTLRSTAPADARP